MPSSLFYILYQGFFEVSKKTNTNMNELKRTRQKLELKWNYYCDDMSKIILQEEWNQNV